MPTTIQPFVQQGFPPFPVAMLEEYVPASVARQNDMAEPARDEQPGFPRDRSDPS
jgi:hypothetical protein